MSRLIDRILDEFKDINYAYNDSSKYDTLKSMLNDAVEVVQVVRCSYCVHRVSKSYGNFCMNRKSCCCGLLVKPDFYCADGERKILNG